jgi:hypothetical protein
MLQRAFPTGFIAPCLPTKIDKLPSGDLWLREIKHDGRLLAPHCKHIARSEAQTLRARRLQVPELALVRVPDAATMGSPDSSDNKQTVIRLLVEMREAGEIPFEWLADRAEQAGYLFRLFYKSVFFRDPTYLSAVGRQRTFRHSFNFLLRSHCHHIQR